MTFSVQRRLWFRNKDISYQDIKTYFVYTVLRLTLSRLTCTPCILLKIHDSIEKIYLLHFPATRPPFPHATTGWDEQMSPLGDAYRSLFPGITWSASMFIAIVINNFKNKDNSTASPSGKWTLTVPYIKYTIPSLVTSNCFIFSGHISPLAHWDNALR